MQMESMECYNRSRRLHLGGEYEGGVEGVTSGVGSMADNGGVGAEGVMDACRTH